MWEDRRGSGEDGRGGRGKNLKKRKRERGRERRERKGEQLYSKCHNKEAKRHCQKKFFFLQVQNRVGFPRQSMNAFCVI